MDPVSENIIGVGDLNDTTDLDLKDASLDIVFELRQQARPIPCLNLTSMLILPAFESARLAGSATVGIGIPTFDIGARLAIEHYPTHLHQGLVAAVRHDRTDHPVQGIVLVGGPINGIAGAEGTGLGGGTPPHVKKSDGVFLGK